MAIHREVIAAGRGGRVPVGRKYAPRTAPDFRSFAGFRIEDARAILEDLRRGSSESWSSFYTNVLMEDPEIQSAFETRINNVVQSEMLVEPGREDDASKRAADAFRAGIEEIPEFENAIANILHGRGHGFSVSNLVWRPFDGWWFPVPEIVQFTDLRYSDWDMQVRVWKDAGAYDWINVSTERDAWLIHESRKAGKHPMNSGDLKACIWPWVMMKWCKIFLTQGLEKQGNGMLYGIAPENAHEAARDEMLRGLDAFSNDHTGIFEAGSTVGILASQINEGAYRLAFETLKGELIKAIHGSTLNTDISSAGANRAAAESQADITMKPRFLADGRAAAVDIRRDVLGPWMRYNALKVQGAATPRPIFRLVKEEAKPAQVDIMTLAVQTGGVVTVDELRSSTGLPPLGPEGGGDEFVQLQPSTSQPMFSRAQEVAAPRPLASRPNLGTSQPKAGMKRTSTKTLPMYSDLMTRLATVPSSTSDDHES